MLPLCTILLALGFGVCWRWRREQRDLLWMVGCFVLFSVGFAAQVLSIPHAVDDHAVVTALFYHAAVWCLAEAISARFKVRMWRILGGLIGGLALLALTYYAYVDEQLYRRIYLLNFGLGAQLGVSVGPLWRVRPVHVLERALQGLFIGLVLSFFIRTMLTMPARDALSYANLGQSVFWMTLQLSLLAFTMLFAMTYLAVAIHDASKQMQYERNRDPLTQLLNRRAFFEGLADSGDDQPVGTLLMCDVDHFKRINDCWGHAAGDAVLQSLADVLQDSVRKTDLVARFGGEEFVLLLYGMPPQAAVQMAQRIGAKVAALRHPMLPDNEQVTASFGVAEVRSMNQLHHALAQADRQLYAAKAAGRNCVRWEPDPPLTVAPAVLEHTL